MQRMVARQGTVLFHIVGVFSLSKLSLACLFILLNRNYKFFVVCFWQPARKKKSAGELFNRGMEGDNQSSWPSARLSLGIDKMDLEEEVYFKTFFKKWSINGLTGINLTFSARCPFALEEVTYWKVCILCERSKWYSQLISAHIFFQFECSIYTGK